MGVRKTFLMNITVKLYGRDSYICRPDTTWERENRDFFSPDYVNDIWYSPVIFARISKAGKCISPKFVSRYYDGLNFGILMYMGDILESGTPESAAFASVLDHTSLLPYPLYLPEVISTEGNEFCLFKNGETVFRAETGVDGDFIGTVENSIAGASDYISQRIGDIVATELAAPSCLIPAKEKRAGISASFCGNELFGLSIIR